MFEDRQTKAYAKLKDGKVEVYKGKDDEGKKIVQTHDRIVAKVVGVKEKDFEYQGEKMKAWDVSLVSGEDEAELSLGYSSNFTRGFFNSLLAADFTKPISISCYVKEYEGKEYNTPSLWQDDEMLKWVKEDMPKTKRVKVGSKEVIDDEEAVVWTVKLVEEINAKIQEGKPVKQEAPEGSASGSALEGLDEPLADDLPF